MAHITLRQRETALAKATEELAREKSAFLIGKADLQRKIDEFAAANNEVALAAKRKRLREREEMWNKVFITAIIFLIVPVVSLGASLLVAEVAGGWRMFLWAKNVAGGHRRF